MNKSLLEAFDPESFRKKGHEVVDLLADYLHNSLNNTEEPVMRWTAPDDMYQKWSSFPYGEKNLSEFFNELIRFSNHLHNPRYMGHQVPPPVPVTAIAEMLTGLLNNGMAIYEMGPVATALEKWIIGLFCERAGMGVHSDGLLTSGGTLASLTALLAARQVKTPGNSWELGNGQNLAIMMPEQSHYSIDRAVRVMGLGSEGIVKVPVDENFKMNTNTLEDIYQQAKKDGKKIFALTANACSTATGTYDNLEILGVFCRKHDIWFHIDAAHGGGVLFSEKYRYLLNGTGHADSVIIDLHKMLMTPALATAVLFRNKIDSYRTFEQDAHYLWSKNEEPEWYNYAKRTFECTKLMMSVKFYSILVEHGMEIFRENVDTLYDLARSFAGIIRKRPCFELATEPESNIVCFRIVRNDGSVDIDDLNSKLRQMILEEGKFYIVQTKLNNDVFLRVSLMNPFTTIQHLNELLDELEGKM